MISFDSIVWGCRASTVPEHRGTGSSLDARMLAPGYLGMARHTRVLPNLSPSNLPGQEHSKRFGKYQGMVVGLRPVLTDSFAALSTTNLRRSYLDNHETTQTLSSGKNERSPLTRDHGPSS